MFTQPPQPLVEEARGLRQCAEARFQAQTAHLTDQGGALSPPSHRVTKGLSRNKLDKGSREDKCQARRKTRGVAGYTSGLQRRMALGSAAELFKLFLLDP